MEMLRLMFNCLPGILCIIERVRNAIVVDNRPDCYAIVFFFIVLYICW